MKEFQIKVGDRFELLRNYWIIPCVAKNITIQQITREKDARLIVELKIMNQQYSHYVLIKKGDETEYLIGQYLEYLQSPDESIFAFETYIYPKNQFAIYFGPVEISTGNELKDRLMKMGDYSAQILSEISIAEYEVLAADVIYHKECGIVITNEGDNYYVVYYDEEIDQYRHYVVSGKTRTMQTSIQLSGNMLAYIDINTKFDSMNLNSIITKALSFAIYFPLP